MTTNLDRDGIFRAVPTRWMIGDSSKSQSVSINIEYQILEFLDNGEWQDWRSYDKQTVDGYHWVVGKDGRPNQTTCDQLAESLGWDGSLKTVTTSQPPQCMVTITVKSEVYEGQSRRKVSWLAPGDAQGPGADPEKIANTEAQIGSLLRAAASTKRREPVALPGAKAEEKKAPPAQESKSTDYDGVPF